MEKINVIHTKSWKILPFNIVHKWRSIILEAISFLLVLLFMYAAVTKLLDYQNFKTQLSKSPFITQFAGTITWALPLCEILIGLTITFNKTKLIGLYLSLFLMTIFTTYIFVMLNYSYYIPCSCGGILSQMDWNTHFWFNILFVIFSIIGILGFKRKTSIIVQ